MSFEARKRAFLESLESQLQATVSAAHEAETSATEAAAEGQDQSLHKEDRQETVLQQRLARGHRGRRERALAELAKIRSFASKQLRSFGPGEAIGLGALVDVEVEGDEGSEQRSIFLLPAGAGAELEGPGGDGFVSVATPASPIGKALMGSQIGDSALVVVAGNESEWTVIDLS